VLCADGRAAPTALFRSRVHRALAAAIGAGLCDPRTLARAAPGRAGGLPGAGEFRARTDESERRRGHGARLLGRLKAEGRALGCRKLVLDTALENTLGHRFYYRQGLLAMSLRFNCVLD
jgi:GNAT superfamily N-acetyltransferase